MAGYHHVDDGTDDEKDKTFLMYNWREKKTQREENLFRKDMIVLINFWKNLPVTVMQLCTIYTLHWK